MAGPERRRLEVPARIFRLAVRDLRVAAAAPENLGAPEEALAPLPRLNSSGSHQETADTESLRKKHEVAGKKRRPDSVGDEDETGRMPRVDSVGAQAENSKKRLAYSTGAEAGTGRKRSRVSHLSADTFKGKSTGTGEGTFSTSAELAAGTSAGRPKSFRKIEREVYERWEDSVKGAREGTFPTSDELAAGTSAGRPKSFKKDEREVYERWKDSLEGEDDEYVEKNKRTKAKDDDIVTIDAAQRAKNYKAAVDLLAEFEAKYSLDIFRQRFALTNDLPIPPPSSDRMPTPPTPASPPPVVEIGTYEEAKTALKEWNKGRQMHLQVSEQLLLSDAERVSKIVKDADAERVVLNPSILEAKVSQGKFLRQMISHTMSELQRYNKMLGLPWMPIQTMPGSSLL